MTKSEFRQIQREVSFIRRLAEELIDEIMSYEVTVQTLFDNRSKKKKGDNVEIKSGE